MLFWLFVIILAVGICLIVVGNMSWDSKKENSKLAKFLYYNDEKFKTSGVIISLISGLIVAIMICCIMDTHLGIDAKVEQSKERYEAITYKVESGACRDEFGLLNKEVIDEIQNWNEDVVYEQKIQNNFWTGIFHPNVYDQFETIDYEKYGRE